MSTHQVPIRVRQVVSEIVGDMPFEQIPDAQQLGSLGLDSLDRMEMLIALEDEFDIVITEQDEENQLTSATTTVLDLAQAVERHLTTRSNCGI